MSRTPAAEAQLQKDLQIEKIVLETALELLSSQKQPLLARFIIDKLALLPDLDIETIRAAFVRIAYTTRLRYPPNPPHTYSEHEIREAYGTWQYLRYNMYFINSQKTNVSVTK